MNLVFGLVLLGTSALYVWAGFTDPEGGPLAGLRDVFAGETPTKHTSATGAAFLASVTATGGVSGNAAPAAATGAASGARGQVLANAATWLGTPYLWGGRTKAGADCSGFTQAVYATVGVQLPRVSAAQALAGKRTTRPQPGDLVAFGFPVHHVGILVAPGQIIHAPHPGTSVRYESVASVAAAGGSPVQYRNVLGSARSSTKAPSSGTVAT